VPTEGTAQWRRLPDYASQVISDIRDVINPGASEPTNMNNDSEGDFRTVLEIRRASVCGSDGKESDATPEHILQFANLLLQPLNRLATAPEEWMCYRVPGHVENLINEDSFTSDLVISKGSTTVLYMPATPDWLTRSYKEALEYFAALPVQPGRSSRELQNVSNAAEQDLKHDHEFTDDSIDVDDRIEKLAASRRLLQKAVDEARERRMELSASAIIGEAHQRALLENLMAVGRVPDLIAELDSPLERADKIYDRLVEREQHLRERREERARQRHETAMQWILFFVGLFSFASVISLAETELFKSSTQGMWSEDNPALNLKVVLVVYLVVIAIGLGLVVYLRHKYRMASGRRVFPALRRQTSPRS
jgi:hypothetical protein